MVTIQSLVSGRKGNVVDSFVIILCFFIMAFGTVTILGSFHGIYGSLLNDSSPAGLGNDSRASAIIQNADDNTPAFWDKMLFTLLMGFFCYVLVSAYFIDTHPIYFIFGVLLMIPLGYVSMKLNNFFYDAVAGNASYGFVLLKMPLTDYVMSHFLIYALCMGFGTLLVLYLKGKSNPAGGAGGGQQW